MRWLVRDTSCAEQLADVTRQDVGFKVELVANVTPEDIGVVLSILDERDGKGGCRLADDGQAGAVEADRALDDDVVDVLSRCFEADDDGVSFGFDRDDFTGGFDDTAHDVTA